MRIYVHFDVIRKISEEGEHTHKFAAGLARSILWACAAKEGARRGCRMKISLLGIGWRVKLRRKRSNHFLTIVNELVIGSGLNSGDDLYYYLGRSQGRNMLVLFLDKSQISSTVPSSGFMKSNSCTVPKGVFGGASPV